MAGLHGSPDPVGYDEEHTEDKWLEAVRNIHEIAGPEPSSAALMSLMKEFFKVYIKLQHSYVEMSEKYECLCELVNNPRIVNGALKLWEHQRRAAAMLQSGGMPGGEPPRIGKDKAGGPSAMSATSVRVSHPVCSDHSVTDAGLLESHHLDRIDESQPDDDELLRDVSTRAVDLSKPLSAGMAELEKILDIADKESPPIKVLDELASPMEPVSMSDAVMLDRHKSEQPSLASPTAINASYLRAIAHAPSTLTIEKYEESSIGDISGDYSVDVEYEPRSSIARTKSFKDVSVAGGMSELKQNVNLIKKLAKRHTLVVDKGTGELTATDVKDESEIASELGEDEKRQWNVMKHKRCNCPDCGSGFLFEMLAEPSVAYDKVGIFCMACDNDPDEYNALPVYFHCQNCMNDMCLFCFALSDAIASTAVV